MEPRISLVTLGVSDVARSRRFYEALGWRASGASVEGTVFFQLGGMALSLYGRAAFEAGAEGFLGRLLRLFRRPRRPPLGSSVEPGISARAGWNIAASGLGAGARVR